MPHLFFFFFSSRRRHTRWPRDWSSDVCSSDLAENPVGQLSAQSGGELEHVVGSGELQNIHRGLLLRGDRSEERRVGKECSSTRSQNQSYKNTECCIT